MCNANGSFEYRPFIASRHHFELISKQNFYLPKIGQNVTEKMKQLKMAC